LPAGKTFLAGSFDLRSNTELVVERGARLIASAAEGDYPHRVFDSGPEDDKRVWIRSMDSESVAITGGGVIDGRCLEFVAEELPQKYRGVSWRPAMTCFTNCRRIRVQDVMLKDSANWTLHFVGCEDIVVHGVTIKNNMKFPNADGIDPDHCRNVRISDCYIETGDDCICLKTTRPFIEFGPTENVTVTGCVLRSRSAAIKIGSESASDIRNVVFDSCVIFGSHRGLGIQLRDEGDVENIVFSNMVVETHHFPGQWWGAAEPVYITALHRSHGSPLGRIRNIRLANLICRGENGIYLSGCEESILEDVVLDNVRLEVAKWTEIDGGFYDRRPGVVGVVESVNAGLYIEHANRVTIRDSDLVWGANRQPYFGPAMVSRHVSNLSLDGFDGKHAWLGDDD
jgi:hypothetical protein